MRGMWDRETVAALLIAAHLPIAIFWAWFGDAQGAIRLLTAFLVIAIWHLVFMLIRAQPPSLAAITTALAIAILAPEDLGALRLALGVSFGVVMGELVFGGWGRNVVHPASVALSFLGFGFPAFAWPVFDDPVAWAAIAAGTIGIALGVMPPALILGAAIVAAGGAAAGLLATADLYAAGLVLILLVADPVTSPGTTLGRWLGGGLFAALVILFANGWTGAAPVQAGIAAALLTSLAAPLLDEAAIALWVAKRRRRHGRT
ncbi:Na+-transporting NADH:ubiquinone oxidoreductase subunit B [Roseivivax lentus]|uniref:Na+-transporting NADH:ubiquinone oxidoreductase subunit B n=1 Tax=Roseivivax lentus TaxID=633194 RepID=A0A1N7P404_9RHOB|nr:RnfABCDGE type electron transport complex subunit D [Roseivivax lentus]SIT05169.1 Na+-transporting NADH:ubiquinone oxidoreductase subunit B [Roseivivax lentus]